MVIRCIDVRAQIWDSYLGAEKIEAARAHRGCDERRADNLAEGVSECSTFSLLAVQS